MNKLGNKIRAERKKNKMTLEELAKQVGISPITLHRVETEKTSPSVFLLSKIAEVLNKPVFSFLDTPGASVVKLERAAQPTVSSDGVRSRVIGPRKMIKENIQVVYGRAKNIDPHVNPGVEYIYCIKGKAEVSINGKSYFVETGDAIAYDAKMEHSMTSLSGRTTYFAVYVQDDKL
jgi:DNA-binding XRE family transcriptional regulator